MEGDLAGVRLAEGSKHLDTTGGCHRRHLAHQTALADARWPHHTDHRAMALHCPVQQARNGGQLPPSTHQIRLDVLDEAMPFLHAQQPLGRDGLIGTLDLNKLRLSEAGCAFNQACGGRAKHHPTGRRDRLHPLRHPHLLTDGGVTQSTRADIASDHLPRVQTDPQPQIRAVAALDLFGKPLRLVLHTQRRQACA